MCLASDCRASKGLLEALSSAPGTLAQGLLSSALCAATKWHDLAHNLTCRDLKTSNILLSKGGATAKIGDVGLAKITLTDLQSSLATVGT